MKYFSKLGVLGFLMGLSFLAQGTDDTTNDDDTDVVSRKKASRWITCETDDSCTEINLKQVIYIKKATTSSKIKFVWLGGSYSHSIKCEEADLSSGRNCDFIPSTEIDGEED